MTLLKCHEMFSWLQVFIPSTAFPDCSHSANNTYALTCLLIHSKLHGIPRFSRSSVAGSLTPNCFTIPFALFMRQLRVMLRAAQLAWQGNILQRTFIFITTPGVALSLPTRTGQLAWGIPLTAPQSLWARMERFPPKLFSGPWYYCTQLSVTTPWHHQGAH